MTKLLALQHIACEPPAAYEDELTARGVGLSRVEVDEGEPLPDWREFAGIVVMGGPMGAYEDAGYPWLADEKRLIAEAADSGLPVWGVCLGAQLLAASLGAAVYPGPEPEIGVLDVELTADAARDPVFADAPSTFPSLQWHSDTFDLPEGATLLATSPAYRSQAFVREHAYGLQFHLEVTPALAAQWGEVPAYARSLEKLKGPGALEALLGAVDQRAGEMVPLARRLFGVWLERVVRVSSPVVG
jgi:GMP synthase (glutamine-hydrolysing)